MIDGKNEEHLRTYGNIRKIASGQGDNYKIYCLFDYNYLKNYYKMIAIDLGKQETPDADPKAMQQINLFANLHRVGETAMYFIIEEAKGTV